MVFQKKKKAKEATAPPQQTKAKPAPPEAPPAPVYQDHFQSLSEARLGANLIERMDVIDLTSVGVLVRFSYWDAQSKPLGIPQVVFVPNVKPRFDEYRLVRSIR